MKGCRKIILAPHDDGGGAFAVLCRLARALVNVADEEGYQLHLYFMNSSAAEGGPDRLKDLVRGSRNEHEALFVPTDNLIWLPKDKTRAKVAGEQIPDMLRKWVRPLWHSWPCEPNWIRPHLPITREPREDWIRTDIHGENDLPKEKWEKVWGKFGKLRELTPELWRDTALGISMGVPQLHRAARREGFPSVEVGDWFFSVGLRGCMQESSVLPAIIAATEPDLRMIEEDEFKAREAWLTLHQAPRAEYIEHLARSPVRLRIMEGALWSGDPLPAEGIENWKVADDLRHEINRHISEIRNLPDDCDCNIPIAYIVTGRTGVWDSIVRKLKQAQKKNTGDVAVIDLKRRTGTIVFLEDGGSELEFVSTVLKRVPGEERHLATCRASDFGITRSAGGVLGFAETRRPSVLVDEPGHWLGRIQRQQCQAAGLCVAIPIAAFRDDPVKAIQDQADKLHTKSDLDQTATAAAKMPVGAERDLAEYLFKTYIE